MARTNRNIPPQLLERTKWFENPIYNFSDGNTSKTFRRCARFDAKLGRDGSVVSDVHNASINSPKGYNSYDEVGSGRKCKRWAKAQAARCVRRNSRKLCVDDVEMVDA